MEIEFTVNKPADWLKDIANKFGVELINKTVTLPKNIGEGYLRHYYLSDCFTLNYLHFKLIEPLIFSRKEGKPSNYSPIIFYINKNILEQDIENSVKYISSKTENGIFWPSSQISSKWKLPVNECISNITIAINHEILQKKLNHGEDSLVFQLLNSSKPFYVFEDIVPEMLCPIRDIIEVMQSGKHAAVENLFLESKVVELVSLFFEKLIERPLSRKISSINSKDVEKLFKVKGIIKENISNVPEIEEISNIVGMSVSKLQKLFKQVFGKSIYQYYLYERMLMARKMLLSRRYTVSEVGYDLGYSNLSHFTKAFRKIFGVNPKEYSLLKK